MTSPGSAAYFDKIADGYLEVYEAQTTGGRARRVRKSRVLELFDKPGGRVLDVGCGPGVIVEEMLALRCEFWGVDGSVKMIAQCRQRFSRRHQAYFSVGDATALPFTDEFFDAVLCMGVIDRIEKHELALREMIRVLKKDGTLIIAVPNLLSPHAFWRNFVFSPIVALLRPLYHGLTRKPRKPALTPFARLHRPSTYSRLIAAHGCKVTDLVFFNFNLLLTPLDEFFPGLAIWVADKAERLCSSKLRWLGAAFVVKGKKVGSGICDRGMAGSSK